MSFTKVALPPKKVLASELTERIQRTQKACSKNYQSFVPNLTVDKREIEISLYKQKYPNNYTEELKTLARVKLPKPNLYVINEENEQQKEFGVREVLVYNVIATVWHPNNPSTEQLCHANIRTGWFQSPQCIITKDELDNITNSKVVGWQNQFWIPFTKENVQKVLDDHNNEYKNLVIVTASAVGLESYYDSKPLTVYNLQEWLEADFAALEGANQGGFLRKDGQLGGTILYQKDQEQKRKKLEAEVSEYKSKSK